MAKVLVCEDDVDQRELLSTFLKHFGHQVIAAVDGESALALARHERPDLVLTDCMLPKLNGVALCQAIKSDPAMAGVRVVLCTAAADAIVAPSKAAGADGLLSKPWDWHALGAFVRTFA